MPWKDLASAIRGAEASYLPWRDLASPIRGNSSYLPWRDLASAIRGVNTSYLPWRDLASPIHGNSSYLPWRDLVTEVTVKKTWMTTGDLNVTMSKFGRMKVKIGCVTRRFLERGLLVADSPLLPVVPPGERPC